MAANTTMLGFIPAPAGRGTFDILWSCLTTLFLYAWTSLHLDLPSKRGSFPFADHIRASARVLGLLVKVWWMLIMLIAPEFVLVGALGEWCEAYKTMRHVNREGELSAADVWTMNDGFFLEMGGLIHNGETVNAKKIGKLIRDKTIPPQPSRAEEIRDKSKSDALGKVLTCAQALWLAIQCLARTIQHLPISTLELGTVGYVFIAIVVNGLYWRKPKDVIIPLEVLSWEARGMSPNEEESDAVNASARGVADNEEEKAFFSGREPPTRWEAWLDQVTMDSEDHVWLVTLVSVCVLYGGWHCLAWNFTFPSVAEQWLWRIGSILTALPALVIFMSIVAEAYLPAGINDLVSNASMFTAFVIYTISRGFILVEMFIGLRRLPAGVFDTVQWMAFIPHV